MASCYCCNDDFKYYCCAKYMCERHYSEHNAGHAKALAAKKQGFALVSAFCECGGLAANTTHSVWCAMHVPFRSEG